MQTIETIWSNGFVIARCYGFEPLQRVIHYRLEGHREIDFFFPPRQQLQPNAVNGNHTPLYEENSSSQGNPRLAKEQSSS